MTKLTPDMQDKFTRLLELGMPVKYVCQALNIDERTYYVWMKLGQRDQGKKESKYFQFLQSVQSVPGKMMARALAQLETAANKGDSKVIIWKLEQHFPDVFKQQATEVNLTLKPTPEQINDFYEKKLQEKKSLPQKTNILVNENKDE